MSVHYVKALATYVTNLAEQDEFLLLINRNRLGVYCVKSELWLQNASAETPPYLLASFPSQALWMTYDKPWSCKTIHYHFKALDTSLCPGSALRTVSTVCPEARHKGIGTGNCAISFLTCCCH